MNAENLQACNQANYIISVSVARLNMAPFFLSPNCLQFVLLCPDFQQYLAAREIFHAGESETTEQKIIAYLIPNQNQSYYILSREFLLYKFRLY